MWNAEKIKKLAEALLPLMSARSYVEINNASGSYEIDSGRALLLLFGTYFTDDFMRQFYDGNGRAFRDAWDQLQVDVEKERPNFKFVRS